MERTTISSAFEAGYVSAIVYNGCDAVPVATFACARAVRWLYYKQAGMQGNSYCLTRTQ